MRIRGEYMYVTEPDDQGKGSFGLMVSGVYRFHLDDENIEVTNTLDDEHLITTF